MFCTHALPVIIGCAWSIYIILLVSILKTRILKKTKKTTKKQLKKRHTIYTVDIYSIHILQMIDIITYNNYIQIRRSHFRGLLRFEL